MNRKNTEIYINHLERTIRNLNREIQDVKDGYRNIIENTILLLNSNKYSNSDVRLRKIKEYLKNEYDVIKEDLYIENDEEGKIIELADYQSTSSKYSDE